MVTYRRSRDLSVINIPAYARRYLGIRAVLLALPVLLALDVILLQDASSARRLWRGMTWRTHDTSPIRDLLDTNLLIRTPGADLVDQLDTATGPYSLTVPTELASGRPFEVEIQCDADIIGEAACPPMYYLHFRGPVAYTVPARYATFRHDQRTGRTLVTVTLRHPGKYELWAYPEWPVPDKCPPELNHWDQNSHPVPSVAGSGQIIVHVSSDVPPPPHHTRHCTSADYRTPLESDWFSLEHIRERYRGADWLADHVRRSNSLNPHGALPDYVYLPYQCKRPALDYVAMADENESLKHVLYLGDSIQRSHFCGHLLPGLFPNGSVDATNIETANCVYSDDVPGYHFADRSFIYTRSPRSSSGRPASTILFSQRFVPDDIGAARRHLDALVSHPTPITHVVANIGMWFGRVDADSYTNAVRDFLHIIIGTLGTDVHITWLHTATGIPAIMCWGLMKRERLRHHSSWANIAIDEIRDQYPMLSIRTIDTFPILDMRPEVASDGRHFVREGPLPDIRRRPMVGRGDDAVHDLMWAAWLEDYRSRDAT